MANSPAVLGSFLAFSSAMGEAKIGGKLQNQVKFMTSETYSCNYCKSILSAVAPSAGLSTEDILAGRTANPTTSILRLPWSLPRIYWKVGVRSAISN